MNCFSTSGPAFSSLSFGREVRNVPCILKTLVMGPLIQSRIRYQQLPIDHKSHFFEHQLVKRIVEGSFGIVSSDIRPVVFYAWSSILQYLVCTVSERLISLHLDDATVS
jgi:hypothetical protein